MMQRLEFGAMALIGAFVALSIYAAWQESEQWREFRESHRCRVVSHERGETHVIVTSGTDGQVNVGTASSADKTGWLCDDGVTYYR